MQRVRVIGLTGGIACGKSTVAAMLRELGAPIIDADELARRVVEPGSPGLAAVVARFGPEVVGADGRLDRKKLGAIVFTDPAARRDLEAITHPRIGAASQAEMARIAATGAPVAIYEAALLVENKLHLGLAGLIVVAVAPEVQLARLMTRDGIGAAEAQARIDAQLPLADKLAVADWVVDNGGSLDHTRAQVTDVWTRVQANEGQRQR
jgi:dephospho-CoA kinase